MNNNVDPEMVLLAQWYNLLQSKEYKNTVEAEIARQVDVVNRQLEKSLEDNTTVNTTVEVMVLSQLKKQLLDLNERFQRKGRRYQSKLKGEKPNDKSRTS